MDNKRPAWVLSRLATASVIALGCVLADPAQAVLVSPVSVSLIAPGGIVGIPGAIDVTDSVSTASGITVGDASQIGSTYMLPGESILFSGNSILLHVAAGSQLDNGDLVTGYLGSGGQHARYVFDGLAVVGQTIVGVNILPLAGVLGGTGGGLAGPGKVSFNLDELTFIDPGTGTSNAFGDFRIDLVLLPVPEPAGWAMALAGLAALRLVLRREAA